MSRRKKTRIKAQELKARHEEDPFEDFEGSLAELYLQKTLHFTRNHLREILITGVVFVVVLILGVLVLAWQQNVEKKSLLAFEKIFENHGGARGLSSASLAIEDLEKYEKKFDNSGTRIRSALLKTKFLIENEEYEKAAQNCLFLSKEMESGELKAYFALRAAFLYERLGKNEEALRAYQDVAKSETRIPVMTVHARYGELRMLLALKRRTDAKAVLTELLGIETDRPDLRKLQKQGLALMLSAG